MREIGRTIAAEIERLFETKVNLATCVFRTKIASVPAGKRPVFRLDCGRHSVENGQDSVQFFGATSQIDWQSLHDELAKHKHLILMLLWQEYKEGAPSGY